ncbi:hypothetical protein B296_00005784 [Ensete ventricosum]|uniref:Uncharacterized protein n=1 Tax=Ensete ventricosum TaxID=4639 RepID=A0A427B7H2_ENSVE|nr:hypothetical protein B296_00005784 [Ensete ventricosum]
MKALVISIWRLCTTKGEVRLQILVSLMEGSGSYRGMIGATGDLDYFSAYIRLREPGKSEDKTEGVEAGGRKGQGSDDESRGAQLPKNKALVRKEVDSEECHSVVEVDVLITKKGTQM